MDKIDGWSRTVNRALDIIFAKYPARTGLGVVFGCALSFLVRLFEPTLKNIASADFSGAPWWGWLSIGILIMHIPTIISLFKQRSIGDDSIDQVIQLIEQGNFTKAEKRLQFRNLIERVASNIAISKDAKQELSRVENELSVRDESGSNGRGN